MRPSTYDRVPLQLNCKFLPRVGKCVKGALVVERNVVAIVIRKDDFLEAMKSDACTCMFVNKLQSV